jgi:hypothetical protein
MRIARGTAALLLLCLAGALLGGCAGLKAEPNPGFTLAGSWRLDPAASDDPQKLLEHMRAEALRILSRQPGYNPDALPRGGRGQGSGPSGDQDYPLGGGPGGAYGPGGPPRGDPLQRSPMAHTIMNAVARGDFLTIRQRPDEFVLDYGTTRRSFTPGQHSVVSAEGGVADQISGWDGHTYVIEVKEQYGSTIKEEYSLSGDGALLEKLHVGASELPAVNLTRVYRPNRDSAPRLAPSND